MSDDTKDSNPQGEINKVQDKHSGVVASNVIPLFKNQRKSKQIYEDMHLKKLNELMAAKQQLMEVIEAFKFLPPESVTLAVRQDISKVSACVNILKNRLRHLL